MDNIRKNKAYQKRTKSRISFIKRDVIDILQKQYLLDLNLSDKVTDSFFEENFLPNWYFFSNKAEEIAKHIFIITQKLDAQNDYLEQAGDDGNTITYFCNVGREYPGKLLKIIHENKDMGITSFDSVKTRSGIRIITIETSGNVDFKMTKEESADIEELKSSVKEFGKTNGINSADIFLDCITLKYLYEEINSYYPPRRIIRHLKIFDELLKRKETIVKIEDTRGETDDQNEKLDESEKRIYITVLNPDNNWAADVLSVFSKNNISMNRTYFDIFENELYEDTVGIISIYIKENYQIDETVKMLKNIKCSKPLINKKQSENLKKKLELLIKMLSLDLSEKELNYVFDELKKLSDLNSDLSNKTEYNNFLLNAFTDFLQAADYNGIDEHNVLQLLLGYDSIDKFFVSSNLNKNISNKPGFRIKHNASRGCYKGGLRIDPIVELDEVAALAFMMTWKCARARILYGGGKGGLMLNPFSFTENKIDYFDTLTNFGRSLFLVTGPFKDVPAGDVGCGEKEIGHLFEGFKSALRELALMAYGIKQGVARIGSKVLSIYEAQRLLLENFGIDYTDKKILKKLITSEDYLEYVTAAQITGKPSMGIKARSGATGRGILYSILAIIIRKFINGEWEVSENLTGEELVLIKKLAETDGKKISEDKNEQMIPDEKWKFLENNVFIKFLRNKKIIIQGSGKVGGSVLEEFKKYDVNIVAVSDAGGVVTGDYLDIEDLLSAVKTSSDRSVINAKKNVKKIIKGIEHSNEALTMECDILVTAALENVITVDNACDIKAKILACGSNGSNTSKGEIILKNRNVTVLYDFLANGGGVTASYFEWLRNLTERFRFEAEMINLEEFNIDIMDQYIMPEFKNRIKKILSEKESPEITVQWNYVLRDIIFTAINEDYDTALKNMISMKTAGFADTQLRVLSAALIRMPPEKRRKYWELISSTTKERLKQYLKHPEVKLFNGEADSIIAELYKTDLLQLPKNSYAISRT